MTRVVFVGVVEVLITVSTEDAFTSMCLVNILEGKASELRAFGTISVLVDHILLPLMIGICTFGMLISFLFSPKGY